MMASQQISVRQDIYNRLKQVKKENESFSDVIERLLEDKSNVQDVLGSFGSAVHDDPEEESIILEHYFQSQKEVRKQFTNRFQ